MFENDADILESQCLSRLNEGGLAYGENLSAHDTRHLDPHGQADGNEDLRYAFAQGKRDGDDQKQGRDGPHHIDEPNHHIVDFASEESAQTADRDADEQAQEHGNETDGQADAAAQDKAAEEIATELVGAQKELLVFRAVAQNVVLCIGLRAEVFLRNLLVAIGFSPDSTTLFRVEKEYFRLRIADSQTVVWDEDVIVGFALQQGLEERLLRIGSLFRNQQHVNLETGSLCAEFQQLAVGIGCRIGNETVGEKGQQSKNDDEKGGRHA